MVKFWPWSTMVTDHGQQISMVHDYGPVLTMVNHWPWSVTMVWIWPWSTIMTMLLLRCYTLNDCSWSVTKWFLWNKTMLNDCILTYICRRIIQLSQLYFSKSVLSISGRWHKCPKFGEKWHKNRRWTLVFIDTFSSNLKAICLQYTGKTRISHPRQHYTCIPIPAALSQKKKEDSSKIIYERCCSCARHTFESISTQTKIISNDELTMTYRDINNELFSIMLLFIDSITFNNELAMYFLAECPKYSISTSLDSEYIISSLIVCCWPCSLLLVHH